uniref:INSM transcriptional repressor 2 n=1 Tax=Chelydra serpentina TaxID=8475 RepID=A0A8C3S3I0_CHESE
MTPWQTIGAFRYKCTSGRRRRDARRSWGAAGSARCPGPRHRPARGKMPRGFLVKRSRRAGGSYRVRRQERDLQQPLQVPPAQEPPLAAGASPALSPLPKAAREEGESVGPSPSPEPAPGIVTCRPTPPEGPAAWGAGGACSAAGLRKAFFERCLSSPASAESFPPAERLLLPPRTSPPAPGGRLAQEPLCPALKRPPRAKAPAKKPKALRKLSFADEVTTSPVLGLRIKAEGPEGRAGPPAGGRTPLGEFICQLCKEQYADPLALAQHRCSRIVRVEYRCPECHKIFSCPANLASHRRWHKPRPAASADDLKPAGQSALCGAGGEGLRQAAPPGPIPGGNELFVCPYCHKKFRRQAYLRKHLSTHEAPRPAAYSPLERGQITFPCHLCGAHFPSADIRDKHRLWHAQQILSCKHCPATFFSSPGLTRHINKCHPTENRQVLLLQMAVRPGC